MSAGKTAFLVAAGLLGGRLANKLFRELVGLTGLPSDLIQQELALLLEKKGISPDEVTMESLRAALADYLAVVAAEMEGSAELPLTEPDEAVLKPMSVDVSAFKWKEPAQ